MAEFSEMEIADILNALDKAGVKLKGNQYQKFVDELR